MTPFPPLLAGLVLGLYALASPPTDPPAKVPTRVLNYIRKAVRARARRSGWDQERVEDACQEIVTRLLQAEGDMRVWERFSNTAFDDPEYHRFHDLLLRAVRSVLGYRGHRVEDCPVAPVPSPAVSPPRKRPARRRHYVAPDRSVRDDEAAALQSREPGGWHRDLMVDVADATDSLSSLGREVVDRRLIEHATWAAIATDLRRSERSVRREFEKACRQLARVLKDYGAPRD